MKRTRSTDEQIIGILSEHEAGAKCADLCCSSSPGAGREARHGRKEAPAVVGRRAMPSAADPAVHVPHTARRVRRPRTSV